MPLLFANYRRKVFSHVAAHLVWISNQRVRREWPVLAEHVKISPAYDWYYVDSFAMHRFCISVTYSKCSKILCSFIFLFSNKMLIFRAGIHKTLVRRANREDPYQTASLEAGLHCLTFLFRKHS